MTEHKFAESDYDECPACGHRFYRYVSKGDKTSVDTIGTHTICVTDLGTFFHGHDVTQEMRDNA